MQNIETTMCLLYKSHQVARLVSHLINYSSKLMVAMKQQNATKLGTKMKFYTFFISSSDFLWLFYSGFVHTFIQFELYHAVETIL